MSTIVDRGKLGRLALAMWAGWSAGLVGRHVECCRREWNGRGDPVALSYGILFRLLSVLYCCCQLTNKDNM